VLFNYIRKNKIVLILLISIILLDIVLLSLSWNNYEYRLFNIDTESNLPTLYQGFKIISVALLLFGYFSFESQKDFKKSLFLIPLIFSFTFLAVDEIGQIHEQLPYMFLEFLGKNVDEVNMSILENGFQSWATWLIFYIPIFFMFYGYLFFLIKKFFNDWKSIIWLPVLGSLFFLVVLYIEYIGTNIEIFSDEKYKYFTHLEEGAEKIGVSFFWVFAFVLWIKKMRQASHS
jgi:hypothetical protein